MDSVVINGLQTTASAKINRLLSSVCARTFASVFTVSRAVRVGHQGPGHPQEQQQPEHRNTTPGRRSARARGHHAPQYGESARPMSQTRRSCSCTWKLKLLLLRLIHFSLSPAELNEAVTGHQHLQPQHHGSYNYQRPSQFPSLH